MLAVQVAPRYRWVIVAALAVLLAVSHGFITSGMTIFDRSIIADLGLSRGDLKFRDVFQIVTGGLWALGIGVVGDRVGPRLIIYAGLAVFAAALFLYSRVTTVEEIYALHVVLAFCYASCHVVVVVLILSRWFTGGLGAALGIVLAGESLGGTIFPQIIIRLIEAEGWRSAMRTMAILPIVMMVGLPWVLRRAPLRRVPETPRSHVYDSGASGRRATAASPASAATGFARFLLQKDVLLLYAAGAGLFYAGGGFIAHAFLNFQDRGFAPQAAASSVSLLFITALAGKGASGFLAERWGAFRVWLSLQVLFLIGGLAYTLANGPWVWIGVLLVGFGWGGCYTVTQAVMTARFTGPWLGRLTGVAVFVEGIAGGLGSWITGVGFDSTGSYTLPFLVLCAAIGVATVIAGNMVRSVRLLPANGPRP